MFYRQTLESQMTSTQGKVVVVTGVTYGLGKAMTERLIALGHTVLGCGRSQEPILSLQSKFPSPHHFASVDVTDSQAVASWAEHLLAVYGPPDLILNNAGLLNNRAPLWEVPGVEFSRLMRVNVEGVANVIRSFVPSMVARQRGIIVNFSSSGGRHAAQGLAPYCASKWAIEGLSRSMAQELPQGMACIPLDPGIIRTQMLETSLGSRATSYPGPDEWSQRAVPYILKLGPKDNGRPLSVP